MAREVALIAGAGRGLSASLARLCAAEGMAVAVASRHPDRLDGLAGETGARAYACDVAEPGDVARLFAAVDNDLGVPDLVVFNASARVRGAVDAIDPAEVRQALLVGCYGGFLVAHQAAPRMLARGSGSLFFTGASASVKGYPRSSSFAMNKFGLRGLAQSLARELAPRNVHVGHFVIDGGIRQPDDPRAEARGPDGLLDPDAIARTYLHIHRQHRSAWTWEIELRPWGETF